MRTFILFILIIFIQNVLSSQTLPKCDTSNAYNFGPNFDTSVSFNPIWNQYNQNFSDIVRFNDRYSISSTIHYRSTPSLPPPTTGPANMSYLKLHIYEHTSKTFRDVKFDRRFKNRIFSNTPISPNDYILSGCIQDSNSSPVNTKGLLKFTDRAGSMNDDYLTSCLYDFIPDGDIILKTIEDDTNYYAFGYKIINQPTRSRVGILYILNKDSLRLATSSTLRCPCNVCGLNGIKLFRIQSIVSDALIDNGELYVCGSADLMNLTRGYIGKIDYRNSTASFNFFHVDSIVPSPANNRPTFINYLHKTNTPGEYYALYFQGGGLGGGARGVANPSEAGIIKFDNSLFSSDAKSFRFKTPYLNSDVFLTNIQLDGFNNLFIGGIFKDHACLNTSGSCTFGHLTFNYKDYNPLINTTTFGYVDRHFVNMDNDPFSKQGGSINSLSTMNKVSRTVALDASNDSLHIAYLSDVFPVVNNTSITHYSRPTSSYLNEEADHCNCVLDSFKKPIMSANLLGNMFINHAGTAQIGHSWFEEVFDCTLSKSNGYTSKWKEEQPVVCYSPTSDTIKNCDYWRSILTKSQKDTICSGATDTLFVELKSPFGTNSYTWSNLSSPSRTYPSERAISMDTAGQYKVICARILSDSSYCYDTFYKTIYSIHLSTEIVVVPSTLYICLGQTLRLYANVNPVSSSHQFLWSRSLLDTLNLIFVDSAGTYKVTVTSPQGCIAEDSIVIYKGAPTLEQEISRLNTSLGYLDSGYIIVCNYRDSTQDTMLLTTVFSKGYHLVSVADSGWVRSGDTLRRRVTLPPRTSTGASCDTFRYTYTNSKPCRGFVTSSLSNIPHNACGDTLRDIDTINKYFILEASLTPDTVKKCFSDSVLLKAHTVGTINRSFSWSHNGSSFSNSTDSFKAYHSGEYRVIMSVGTSYCKDTAYGLVQNFPEIHQNARVRARCINETNGSIELNPSGGTPLYSFQWIPSSIGNTAIADSLDSGYYYVVVTDSNGCSQRDTHRVELLTYRPKVEISSHSNPSCGISNGSMILQGKGFAPYSYSVTPLMPPATITDSFVDGLDVGLYNIFVVDSNNCRADTVFSLSNNILFNVRIERTGICDVTKIDAYASPMPPSYTFSWYNMTGSLVHSTSSYVPSNTDPLYLVVSDPSNCKSVSYIEINHIDGSVGSGTIFNNYTTARNPVFNGVSTVSNKRILVKGAFHIDTSVRFDSCVFIFENMPTADAKVIVDSPSMLTLYNCQIATCGNYLGKGIEVESGANLNVQNTYIADMFKALEIKGNTNLVFKNNTIEKSVIGMHVSNSDSRTVNVSTDVDFSGNAFVGTNTSNLKTKTSSMSFDPSGSNFGLMPNSSIDYTNSLSAIISYSQNGFLIGSCSGLDKNLFKNWQNGISVRSGNYTLRNNQFVNINPLFSGNLGFMSGICVYGNNDLNNDPLLTFNANCANFNAFYNSKTGIKTNGYSLHADNLQMDTIESGIEFYRTNNSSNVTSIEVQQCNLRVKKSAVIIEDQSSSSSTPLFIDVLENYIEAKNSSTSALYTSPAISLKADASNLSFTSFPSLIRLKDNFIHVYSNEVGTRYENMNNLNVSGNSIYLGGNSTSGGIIQIAGSYYKDCKNILDEYNWIDGNLSVSNAGGTKSISSQFSNVYPISQVIEDVTNSNFTCNVYGTELVSGLLVKASSSMNTSTSLTHNNFYARGYGILIEPNSSNPSISSLDQQFKTANKFYCGAQNNWAIWTKSISGANPSAFPLSPNTQFVTGASPTAFILPCQVPCYPVPPPPPTPACPPSNYTLDNELFPDRSIGYMASGITPTACSSCVMDVNTGLENKECETQAPPIYHEKIVSKPYSNSTQINNDCYLYPNPSTGISTLEFEHSLNLDSKIVIYDVTNRQVSKMEIRKNLRKKDIGIQTLESGIYNVIVTNSSGTICKKKLILDK